MYSKEECKKHYEGEILPYIDIKGMEEERLKTNKKLKNFKYLLIFIGILITISFIFFFPFIIPFLLFSLLMVYMVFYSYHSLKQRSNFKETVISKIISFYDNEAIYDSKKHIDRETFNKTGLYSYYNSYNGEDYVKMKIYDKDKKDFTELEFCELRVEEESTDSKGNKRTTTVFHGIFYIVQFNKKFNCTLHLNGGRGSKMILEDDEFNKMFKAKTNDQVEGRYILSTSFMQRLKDYKNTSGKYSSMKLAFIDNTMYVGISTYKNKMELKLNTNLSDFDNIYPYYQEIEEMISIVEDLNLNNKIWHH